MSDLKQRLRQRKPIVAAGGIALLAILTLVVLVMPKMSAVKTQQAALDDAQQQGVQLTTQVQALLQAKHDAPQVRQELASIDDQIPSTVELPLLIRQVQQVADKAAVDFVQIEPGTPTVATTSNYSTIPTQISATGSYFSVTEFLYRLETLPRAVKVTNLTLGPGPGGLPELQMQLTAEVYTTDVSAGPGSVPGPTTTNTGGA